MEELDFHTFIRRYNEIYKETDKYEQDDCYEIDGYRLCADCVMRYLRREHKVKLLND